MAFLFLYQKEVGFGYVLLTHLGLLYKHQLTILNLHPSQFYLVIWVKRKQKKNYLKDFSGLKCGTILTFGFGF
jgi:hypothetical protein